MAKGLRRAVLKSILKLISSGGEGNSPYQKDDIKSILLINITAIGDTLMCTPAIRVIREDFPGAHIAVLAGSSARQVLKANPSIDEIIPNGDKVNLSYLVRLPWLIKRLRASRPDLAVVLHGNDPQAVPLAYMSGARFRLGLTKTDFPFLLTWYKPLWTGRHLIHLRLDILKDIGIDGGDSRMELFLTESEEEGATEFLRDNAVDEPYAAIHPFASKPTRSWPLDMTAELCSRLFTETGLRPVIIGGPKEVEASKEIIKMAKVEPTVTAGKLGLRTAAALIKKSSVIISTDSGPMHIGQALGVPTVAILGSTLRESTGPIEENSIVLQDLKACLEKRPCKDYRCSHISCMKAIGVNEVIDAVNRLNRV